MSRDHNGRDTPQDDQPSDFVPIPDDYDAVDEIPQPPPINSIQRRPRPWHRPRKQYVRRNQWVTSLTKLIDEVKPTERVLYLGLPGDEFLDVRYLAGGPVSDAGLELRFLGFNTSDEAAEEFSGASPDDSSALVAELSAFEETRNHQAIDELSDLQPDDIRRLAKVGSPAYIKVDKFGPFDVVNLDLTQSVFAKNFQGDTYTAAIQQLLGLQARATHDWLLWITTRVDAGAVHSSDAETLLRLVQGRFEDCAELLDSWTPDQFDAPSPMDMDLNSCSERDFAAIAFIGFCLWLYGLGEGPVRQPMSVVSSFGYRVREEAVTPDMFSLVIRISPKVAVPIDNTGLTPQPKATALPDKCEQLSQIMTRYQNSVDIEQRIENDLELRAQLVEETAKLLELLRIDRDSYIEWVEQYRA